MRNTFKKLPLERQTAIMETAAGVFARKGYFQANVAEICEVAGISMGSLYKYFENKKVLFIDVFQFFSERMFIDLLNVNLSEDDDSIYDTVLVLLQKVEQDKNIEAAGHFAAIYLDIGSQSMNEFATCVSRRIEIEAKKFWLSLIKKGKQRGEIHPSVDDELAAYLIDNNFMIFVFTFISEHYRQRFDGYLGEEKEELTIDERIQKVMKTLRFILRGS
jgi:TetR/AcrR family transcriptional regulator